MDNEPFLELQAYFPLCSSHILIELLMAHLSLPGLQTIFEQEACMPTVSPAPGPMLTHNTLDKSFIERMLTSNTCAMRFSLPNCNYACQVIFGSKRILRIFLMTWRY